MMQVTLIERRWRELLLGAMIPATGAGLPGFGQLDLAAFWDHFDGKAPLHLRLGLRVSTLCLAAYAPVSSRGAFTLDSLDAAGRDRLLCEARELPGLSDLVEVMKIVACLAYFDDSGVQAQVRGGEA